MLLEVIDNEDAADYWLEHALYAGNVIERASGRAREGEDGGRELGAANAMKTRKERSHKAGTSWDANPRLGVRKRGGTHSTRPPLLLYLSVRAAPTSVFAAYVLSVRRLPRAMAIRCAS